jgi:hypothetical protein
MLYFAQKILRTKPGNWTFVIVTAPSWTIRSQRPSPHAEH